MLMRFDPFRDLDQGVFIRQLFLGDSLDVDNIQATYDQGVLTLTIPVEAQAKPKKVAVLGGTGNGNGRRITSESEAQAAEASSAA
jgi:hypothetical protein